MAGEWTIGRDRQHGEAETGLPATRQLEARSRRKSLRQLGWVRSSFVAIGKLPAGVASHRARGRLRAWWAVPLLAVMTVVAALLALATYGIVDHAVAVSQQTSKRVGGPLVIPAPRDAAGFPRRFGLISDPAALAIVSEFRQRFGAAGAALVTEARRNSSVHAGAKAAAGPQVKASWTSGLYGEPGHLDPETFRPSWIMYLGLDTPGMLGRPSATIASLMTTLLGPYSLVSPWSVAAGHRGGSANCAVAWLGQTSVSVCGWATDHTVGALVSPVRDTSVGELATLMIKMRFDLQR